MTGLLAPTRIATPEMLRCVTLWIGDSLGPVERACLRSILRQGHALTLYCYQEPIGIPAGVDLADASAIIPESAILRDSTGSVALFSDWFRYELLHRRLGTWVDADVYLVGALDAESPYLFGIESPGILNNAVLRAPSDSSLISGLLEPFVKPTTPKWMPLGKYSRMRARELLTGHVALADVPWGTTGPRALTGLARRHGLMHLAQPQDLFYPVPWSRASWILDPDAALEEVISERTVAVHLWNHCIRGIKNRTAPKGSFLARLQSEGEA